MRRSCGTTGGCVTGHDVTVDVVEVDEPMAADLVRRDPALLDEAAHEPLRQPRLMGGGLDLAETGGRSGRRTLRGRIDAFRDRHDL